MTESEIQRDIMNALTRHPMIGLAHVNTTGKVKGRNGHWITLGYPGISDITGMLKDGRFFAIEVKKPGSKPTEVQQDYINKVNEFNGVAGWCDSVEGALDILEG